jgi:hypothetical protein
MGTFCNSSAPAIGPQHPILTPTAKETVLVANTPTFLLDRLRGDTAVQYVLASMKPLEIIDELQTGLATPPSDATRLVLLYVYLAALSATDPSDQETWTRIGALDLSQLEWGEVLKKLIQADAIPTTVSSLNFKS